MRPAPRRMQGSVVVFLTAAMVLLLPMLALLRWRYNAARDFTPVHVRRAGRHDMPSTVDSSLAGTVPTHSLGAREAEPVRTTGVSSIDQVGTESLKSDFGVQPNGQLGPDTSTAGFRDQDQVSGMKMSFEDMSLTPRADSHCDSLAQKTFGSVSQAELFKCRKEAAQALAEKACEELATNPPNPPFTKAELNIESYIRDLPGIDILGPSMTLYQPKIPIAVEPRSDFVSQGIMKSGVWELQEVKTVLQGLQRVSTTGYSHMNASALIPQEERAVLLDIGANIGIFSFVAAALGYNVYSFEAMPRNVAALHQTLCWNPDLLKTLTVFPYGLAEEERGCLILSDSINVADGHVVCNQEELDANGGDKTSRGSTYTVTLDNYLAGVHVDVVKIDVEGYEPHVLAGAGDSLQDVRYVMTEVSASDMPKKNNATFEDIANRYLGDWESRGFAIHVCDDKTSCFETDILAAEDAVAKIQPMGIANALMEPATIALSPPP